MLSNFIQNAIPDSIKNKFPNLSKILGVQSDIQSLAENKNLATLFKNFGYKQQQISKISYICPLYKYTGTKDIVITTMAKVQVTGGVNTSEEAIPYLEQNVYGANYTAQFAGVRPVIVTLNGEYNSREKDITSLMDSIDSNLKKVNSLAQTIKAGAMTGIANKYNKAKNAYNNVKGMVNSYLNQAESIFKAGKKIFNAFQSGNIDDFLTTREPQYEIARFIYSTILLSYARIPIDLSMNELTYSNMLLIDYNFEVPEGENFQTLNFTLTFKHIPVYNTTSNIGSSLKQNTQLNKSLGAVSSLKIK